MATTITPEKIEASRAVMAAGLALAMVRSKKAQKVAEADLAAASARLRALAPTDAEQIAIGKAMRGAK